MQDAGPSGAGASGGLGDAGVAVSAGAGDAGVAAGAGDAGVAAGSASAGAAETAATPSSALANLPWTTILSVLAVVVVLAVVIGVVWWLRKRKQQSAAEAVPTPAGPGLSQRLADIWRPFYRDLPMRAHYYPSVIVVGSAGAGKSHLIDLCVDWRGQAGEYLPSRTNDSLMQLYAGSGILAQELSAPLLYDVSRAARRALGRMWRHLRAAPVTVVAVIDASIVATSNPDELDQLAHLIRGKLRTIESSSRRRAQLRLCLTHFDRVDGYAPLAQLLHEYGGQLSISPKALTQGGDALAGVMAPLDDYLALALTRYGSDEFARVVGFYRAAPGLFSALVPFARTLTGEGVYGPRYELERVALSGFTAEQLVGAPFAVDRSAIQTSVSSARRRVYATCAATIAAAAVLLAALFGWHGRHIADAERQVASFEQAVERYQPQVSGPAGTQSIVIDSAERRAREAMEAVSNSEILWLSLAFNDRKEQLRAGFVDAIRDAYLLPRVSADYGRTGLIYTLALLYASRDNDLGALVRSNVRQWGRALDMPERVALDYIDYSDPAWAEAVALPGALPDTDDNTAAWQQFLRTLATRFGQSKVSNAELAELRAQLPSLDTAADYDLLTRAGAALLAQPELPVRVEPLLSDLQPTSQWVEQNYQALSELSALVRRSSLDVPDLRGQALTRLADALANVAQSVRIKPATYELTLDGEEFRYQTSDWADILVRSRSGILITTFRADAYQNGRSPFFPATSGGLGLAFSDDAERYSQAAYSGYVAPALRAFSGDMDTVMLDQDDRLLLIQYLQESTDAYAEGYRRELDAYYQSYRFSAATLDVLRFGLAEYSQPSASFVEFLRTVRDMASLPIEDGALFQRVRDRLSLYQPIVAVATEKDGAMPALEPYLAIIAELAALLDPSAASATSGAGATASAGAAGAATDDAAFALDLSPLGELALGTLQGTETDRRQVVQAWLDSVNIDRSLRRPFLDPVRVSYQLGFEDLEVAAVRAWTGDLEPMVSPLLERFPFVRGVPSEVAIADLETTLNSKTGQFWTAFNSTVGLVCVYSQAAARWRYRPEINPPRGMLPRLNDLWRLSQALWDQDGKPQPLLIPVRPQPLPTDEFSGRVATVAYLNAGASTVYAFNQKPELQTLSLEWWQQGASSVGVRLQAPGQAENRYRTIEISDSAWSFYRLLDRAQISANNTASWQVPVTGDDDGNATVSFTPQIDPWALFRIRSRSAR